jgi:hypothetical protein
MLSLVLFTFEERAFSLADKSTVKDLLSDEIKDLYSAERQLTKAIPKMAKDRTIRS